MIAHPPAWRHRILAALSAAAIVVVISLFTNHQQPLHDALEYVQIAERGIVGNSEAAAPYAYRPAVPLAAWFLIHVLALSADSAFLVLAWIGALSLLTVLILFVYRRTSSMGTAMITAAVLGFSFYQVRYPLTMNAMVDIEAYPLIVLATWSLLERRYVTCLALCLVGLFFKEFLLIPIAPLVIILRREYLNRKSTSLLVTAIAAIAGVSACFVLPRVLIPVHAVYGNNLLIGLPAPSALGYVHNLRTLLSDPLDPERILNITFATAGYWLPTLVLMNGPRLRHSWHQLSGERVVISASLIFLFVLALVGGTNIMIFVTYGVAAQAIVLSAIYRDRIHWVESLYALVVVIAFNRLWMPVPSYVSDFFGAIDMFGGWGSRLTIATGYRVLELAGYILVAVGVRRMVRQSSVPAGEETRLM